jgi:hypothetical protein
MCWTPHLYADLPQWAVPLLRPIWSLFARNEYEGALTTIWAATHPSLEGQGGVFLDSCKVLAQVRSTMDKDYHV